MKRIKKYMAIFLALLILTMTMASGNVYADQNNTQDLQAAESGVLAEIVGDTEVTENPTDNASTEEVLTNEEEETSQIGDTEEHVTEKDETSNDTSTSEELKQSDNSKEEEESKRDIEAENEETQEVIQMTANELTETVSGLYEDMDFDSSDTYTTKTLIVMSDHSDFDNYGAVKIIQYDTMYILQYETEDATKNAYKNLKKDESISSVEIDALVEAQIEGEEAIESSKEKSDFALFLESKEQSNEVKVAILDSGIDLTNEIFRDRVIDLNINLSSTGDENSIEDDNSHGTDMAKIIVSHTPTTVKIMPIKIANESGKATVLNTYLGIKLAIENNADIINISMGTITSSTSAVLAAIIEEAVSKNITVVAAAGNDNANVAYYTPANIDSVITVSATDRNGTITSFSNYGDKIDYSSLGENGTSTAAANVSTIIAIIKSIYPEYSLEDIHNLLKEYAVDLGEEEADKYYGNGFISLQALEGETSNTEKEENNILAQLDWKNMSDDEFNKILYQSEQYMVGKFLSDFDEEDFNLALSKSEYLNNTTVVSKFDDEGNLSSQEEIKCYQYCMNEYDMVKNELQTYDDPSNENAKFKAASATIYVNINATDGAFTSTNKVTLKGASSKNLSSYTVWVNGGNALTGLTMTTTPENTGGTNLGFAIASNAWSYGIYLSGTSADSYTKSSYIRQAGVVFQVKYSKLTGYQFKSVSGSYPKAMFSGLSKNGTGKAGSESAQLWKYGSNSASNFEGASDGSSDNANSTAAFNKSTPSIWIVGDLEEIISSAPTLTITYEPIQYLQTVNVSYQNADSSYGGFVEELSSSYAYGTTFSWSKTATSVYEAASIDSYRVTSDKINPVTVKRISNVSANTSVNSSVTSSGWYKGLPTITFTGSDPNLNISSVTVNSSSNSGSSTTRTVSEGTSTYSYFATNVNGVSNSSKSITVSADNSAPINVSITASTAWTNSTVPLTVKGQDTLSGLASLKVYYSSNNSTWTEYGAKSYTGQVNTLETVTSITANKNGYYKVIATDRVGYETQSTVINITNIDKSAPTLAHTIDGIYKNGWYKESAVLNLTASDETGGSGIKSITVNKGETDANTRSVDVTSEGSNFYECYATDNASNETAPKKEITVRVDASAPIDLSMTPNTTEWTKDPVKITVQAQDTQSGVGSVELQYTKNKKDSASWITYQTLTFSGAAQVNQAIAVTNNGYYRMIVTDQVGYQTVTADGDILEIGNYDPDKPDANTIGIEPDTTQWVDESTGVEVTSYGSDELSGLSTVEVWELNVNKYKPIKIENYNGETSVESTTYDTHYNNSFLTNITDKAGNNLQMNDEEALEVDNIDPEAPEIIIESISSNEGYISTKKGYIIQAVLEDTQSGVSEVALQKLDEEGKWEDYNTSYQIITKSALNEENIMDEEVEIPVLSKSKRERVIVATANPLLLGFFNQTSSEEQEVRKQGEEKVIIQYTVYENGTYRVKGADLVENTSYTANTVEVSNLDGSNPEIRVDGNPTIWQNTDALITVIASDADSKIVTMMLDGEEQSVFENEEGEYYFTFTAIKNQEFSVTASDEAGNTTTKVIQVTKIDKEAPTLDTVIQKSWLSMLFGSYRTLKLNGLDSLSGIKSVAVVKQDEEMVLAEYAYEQVKKGYTGSYKIHENGEYTVTITDQAGNITVQTISEGNLDFSAPWLMVEGNPAIWQNADATITVTAYDEDSAITSMTLDGTKQEFYKNETGNYVFTFTAVKNQTFHIAAYDEAGNVTGQTIEVVKIDKEAPDIEAILEKEWNENGYRSMRYEGLDRLSGIADIVIVHEEQKEIITSYAYENEQKDTNGSYEIYENGEYVITIKDHAGNSTSIAVTENAAKILKAIEVVVPPYKTTYYETQNFKKKGMVVDAIYNDNSRKQNIKEYVILNGTNLPLAQAKINLSYTEDDVTVYTDTPIKVIEKTENTPTDNSDDPITPQDPAPITPKTPISPTPTPVGPTVEGAIKETVEKVQDVPTKEEKDIPDNTGLTQEGNMFPIGAMLAGAGLFIIILFLLLSNIKIYARDEEGEWKFLGKTRALKAKEKHLVRISKLVRIRSASNSYKLVFSKMFKKFHEECDLLIKIDKQDYEKYLEKDNDTVYVEYKE